MSDVQEAIEKIQEGFADLAEALQGADGDGDSGSGAEKSADEKHTEKSLKALDRDELLAAAEKVGVEVTKGQKATTIIPAILAKQEAASDDDDDDDDDDPDDDKSEKKSKKDKKKKDKKTKGAGKSKGRK